MSWKASSLGALVVVLAGLAVGVGIGGKTATRIVTATRTLTVTVVHKVKAPAPQPTTTPPSTTGEKTTSPSANSGEQYLTDYLESQGGAEQLDQNAENASMDTTAAQRELEGQTYPHAVAFNLEGQGTDGALTASYQIPTPGFTKLTSSAIGLQTSTNASTVYHLAVYKNEDNSPRSVILYQADFRGPSTVHRLSVPIEGATDLLFVWTHKSSEPEDSSTFVLADPVLTGTP